MYNEPYKGIDPVTKNTHSQGGNQNMNLSLTQKLKLSFLLSWNRCCLAPKLSLSSPLIFMHETL